MHNLLQPAEWLRRALFPTAARNIALLPPACGEKKLVTSSSKNVSPLAPNSATGNSRGFAFVEMQDEAAAQEVIRALNGSKLGNRTPVVNKSRPRAARADTGRGNDARRFGRG